MTGLLAFYLGGAVMAAFKEWTDPEPADRWWPLRVVLWPIVVVLVAVLALYDRWRDARRPPIRRPQ